MTAGTITTHHRVSGAMLAWEEGARRRRSAGIVERAADAAVAGGGLVLANATLPLDLGLPAERPGMILGVSLLAAGFAWMSRLRARRISRPVPAVERAMAVPVQTEAWRAA